MGSTHSATATKWPRLGNCRVLRGRCVSCTCVHVAAIPHPPLCGQPPGRRDAMPPMTRASVTSICHPPAPVLVALLVRVQARSASCRAAIRARPGQQSRSAPSAGSPAEGVAGGHPAFASGWRVCFAAALHCSCTRYGLANVTLSCLLCLPLLPSTACAHCAQVVLACHSCASAPISIDPTRLANTVFTHIEDDAPVIPGLQ